MMAEKMKNTIFLQGHGGEVIIGKLDSRIIQKWKEKNEVELLREAMNNNDVCHQGGIYINKLLSIILSKEGKKDEYLEEDVCYDYDQSTLMGNLDKGYYSLYISEGKVSLLSDLKLGGDAISIDDIDLIAHRVAEIDEVELNTQEEYLICNQLMVKEKVYDLEFDDSGLDSKLFIFRSNGEWEYQIVYQDGEWLQ